MNLLEIFYFFPLRIISDLKKTKRDPEVEAHGGPEVAADKSDEKAFMKI